jgi:hypothetical protein
MGETATSISLTTRGLAELPSNIYKNDFAFIVGDRRYDCPSVIADLLSPRLRRLREVDCSIDEYELDVDDSGGNFAEFLSLAGGATVVLTAESRLFYSQLCVLLENRELLLALLRGAPDGRAADTILPRLKILASIDCDLSEDVAIAAAHFSEIPISQLASTGLDLDVISAILSHPSLRAWSEDSIVSLIGQLPNSVSLLAFVRFEWLSRSGIEEVIELLSSSFEMLSFPVWERICARLRLDVSVSGWNSRTIEQRSGPIIRSLYEHCHRNICDSGLVSVTASHTNSSCYGSEFNGGSPKAVFDLDSRKGWYDNNKRTSWLQIDFLTRQIHVDSYTITFGKQTETYKQRWTLEGSADADTWEVIDDHSSEETTRHEFEVAKFECNRPSDRAFRYLRLSARSYCWGGQYQLGLSCLEFFGILRESK